MKTRLTLGQCTTLACLWEVSAPKVGNVHRGADHENLRFEDFLAGAVAIAPAMDEAAGGMPVGRVVLTAAQAMLDLAGTNTHLGTILAMAPLAAVPRQEPLALGVAGVLAGLTADDARDVYQAIRLVNPGGLGKVQEMDVADSPPADLLAAMRLAQDRDLIAREYVTGFAIVLGQVVPWLKEGVDQGLPLAEAIVVAHLRLLAEHPDSLIARKCGPEFAAAVSARAAAVAGNPVASAEFWGAVGDLDFWLRSAPGRNPGTTADLIGAGLFAALREGIIGMPSAKCEI